MPKADDFSARRQANESPGAYSWGRDWRIHLGRALLVALVVYSTAPLADAVYKGKDSSGKTIYSDKPFEGSQQVEVDLAPTYSSPPVTTKLNPTQKTTPLSYQLTILTPSQDQTFTNEITTINVGVSITPGLQKGDKIQLILNGQPHGTPSEATTFTLQNLFRGSYKVQAQVISEGNPNTPLAQSNEVTFYQKRGMIR